MPNWISKNQSNWSFVRKNVQSSSFVTFVYNNNDHNPERPPGVSAQAINCILFTYSSYSSNYIPWIYKRSFLGQKIKRQFQQILTWLSHRADVQQRAKGIPRDNWNECNNGALSSAFHTLMIRWKFMMKNVSKIDSYP